MTILSAPPSDWNRPKIPPATVVALLKAFIRKALGTEVHVDHRPPLADRQWNSETNDTIPPANDPAFLEVITTAEHDQRTNGLKPGEKRITTVGSDAHRRAKTRRLRETPARLPDLDQARADVEMAEARLAFPKPAPREKHPSWRKPFQGRRAP